jgi:hypothetical protein
MRQLSFTSASPVDGGVSPARREASPALGAGDSALATDEAESNGHAKNGDQAGDSTAAKDACGNGHSRNAYGNGNGAGPGTNGNGHAHLDFAKLKPVWDADLNRLTLGDVVVKEYRTPAPNQQRILAAFQEEDWPVRIDDPLPPHPEQDPKRRLHETIVSLNRNQRNELMRFCGDGNGMGVRWVSYAS